MKMRVFVLIITLFTIKSSLDSQLIDPYVFDALRYADFNSVNNARTGALGIAYHGILNDNASMFYNPAGLSLFDKVEVNVSSNYAFKHNEAFYLGRYNEDTNNEVYLSNFALSIPITDQDGNSFSSFGIGFNTLADFSNRTFVGGFNKENSYIESQFQKGEKWVFDHNLAGHGEFIYDGNLTQNSVFKERGGLRQFTIAYALNVDEKISLGVSFNTLFGNYQMSQTFFELDNQGVYNERSQSRPYGNLDFNKFVNEYEHEISAYNFNIGIIVNPTDNFRFSASLITPQYLNIEEHYFFEYYTQYDDLRAYRTEFRSDREFPFEFQIYQPLQVSFGSSIHIEGLTISGGLSYSDLSRMKFESAPSDIMALNRVLSTTMSHSFIYGLAAEMMIPVLPIQGRASFQSRTSPYRSEIGDRHTFALGAGIFVAKGFRLDFMARYHESNNFGFFYENAKYTYDYRTWDFAIGLNFRY